MKRVFCLFTLISLFVTNLLIWDSLLVRAQEMPSPQECQKAVEALDAKYKEAMKLLDQLEEKLRKAARITQRYSPEIQRAYPRTYRALARRAASVGLRFATRAFAVIGAIELIYSLLLYWDKTIENEIIEDLMREHSYTEAEAIDLAQEIGDRRAHVNEERSSLGLGDLEYLAHLAELFDEQRSCRVGSHKVVDKLMHPTRLLELGPIEDSLLQVPIGGWGPIPGGIPIDSPTTTVTGCDPGPSCLRTEIWTASDGKPLEVCVECKPSSSSGNSSSSNRKRRSRQ